MDSTILLESMGIHHAILNNAAKQLRIIRSMCELAFPATITPMPYRILCNGTFQKSQEARSGLGLASPHRTSLHNNRYGVQISTEQHIVLHEGWEDHHRVFT